MTAALVIASTFGALLGLRFNVWALLLCLGATIPATTIVMLLSSGRLTSAMLGAFALVTSMEVGYLAGAYVAQIGMLRRAVRLAPSSINRHTVSR